MTETCISSTTSMENLTLPQEASRKTAIKVPSNNPETHPKIDFNLARVRPTEVGAGSSLGVGRVFRVAGDAAIFLDDALLSRTRQ
jgi:hypothetical protein